MVVHKAKHVGVFLKIQDHEVGCPLCMVKKNVFPKVTACCDISLKAAQKIVISGLNLGLET